MALKHGPAYRLPCPARSYWVGKTSGKLRAHKGPVRRNVTFTGQQAADVRKLAELLRF